MKHRIAVYGSLLKDFSNYNRILKDKSEFIGEDTIEGFDLYPISYFPGILPGSNKVKVEIYDVEPDVFRTVRSLEGYNPNNPTGSMYLEHRVETTHGRASIYVWNLGDLNKQDIIKDGDWRNYKQRL